MRIDNLSTVTGGVVATGWEPEGISDAEVDCYEGRGSERAYRSHWIMGVTS